MSSLSKLPSASSTRFRHFLTPIAPQRSVTQLLVVGLAVAERMVGQLEVRSKLSVEEQRRAYAGPEGDDELEPGAAHDVQALQVGVVGDPHRTAEARPSRRPSRSKPVHAASTFGDCR